MRLPRPTRRKAILALFVVLALSLPTRLARAASFHLSWSAPDECPSRERIMARARTLLREDAEGAGPRLFVHGAVHLDDSGISMNLRLTDELGADLGERRVHFDHRRCEAIEEPTALLVAMMISGARARAPTAPAPNNEVPPPPARSRERTPETAIAAAAVASAGLVPNVGLGGALRCTATFSSIVLGVEGSFEGSWAIAAGRGEATFRFYDLGLLAGVRVVRSRVFEIVPLLEARGGILSASATGFQVTYGATRPVGIVAAGVLGRLRLASALHLEVMPDVRVAFSHEEFSLRRGGELIHIHATAPVEGRVAVGVGWVFR